MIIIKSLQLQYSIKLMFQLGYNSTVPLALCPTSEDNDPITNVSSLYINDDEYY